MIVQSSTDVYEVVGTVPRDESDEQKLADALTEDTIVVRTNSGMGRLMIAVPVEEQ